MTEPFINPLPIPVIGFAAYSGSGKTTLLCQLIPELQRWGLNVAVIKHAHHNFDIDKPGKDSFLLRQAGAQQVLIASAKRYAHLYEYAQQHSPQLDQLLSRIDVSSVDIVLVEGFKQLGIEKIEVHRQENEVPLLCEQDDNVIAIACCDKTPLTRKIVRLNLDDIPSICQFIVEHTGLTHKAQSRALSCSPLPDNTYDVEQAISHIMANVNNTLVKRREVTEYLRIEQSFNRVLANDIFAPIDVPQNTNSAMDGYAFAYQSWRSQLPSDDVEFDLIAQVLAGQQYSAIVGKHQTVSIMTGAKMPAGTDTVVAKERAKVKGSKVIISGDVCCGQNVRQAGEDIEKGRLLFSSGERITAAKMGLLASIGQAQVDVHRALRVAIFSTGDEVCLPDTPLEAASIYDANRYSLTGLLKQLHCEVIDLGIVKDSQQSLITALTQADAKADIVISTGGVSVGDADYIKSSLEQLGHIEFWRVAMRPGRPLAFGVLKSALFFGLPGNPVAAMICFILFVQPAIRTLAGESNWQQMTLWARAGETLRSRKSRDEYLRGYYQDDQHGQLVVRKTGPQGSGILSSMVAANCLIHLPYDQQEVHQGQLVKIIPLNDLL
ncbi:bifunctional molybdopterin-guanine dinucleotide biosynthesis adaptor protein MobB/molybdopterin molybdotransferase MoeA [Thalassotalea aquiviva]|uniref:bifunctional molybdopterin-guanine dinucleotide biosynthesis adaptor protein MobB/molybdopterin molybdotransferase MoeA n=1 Tax=Thalassotalea aquiviva TaxID=3242415 RepID=UPI00352B006F